MPAGVAADGLPLAVQLVGRLDDETTLLSLSAQLEAARPWTMPVLEGDPVNLLLTPRAFVRRHLVAPVARLAGSPLPSPLVGRIVLVTGASSGVGEASAKAVAACGATVLCVARRQGELDRVVGRDRGGRRLGVRLRLRPHRPAATDALVERVLAEHGAVDMLVNNAGRSIRRSLEFSYDRMHDFERTMAINYFGPVRLILGLLPAMREQRFGHVVNIVTWGVQLKAPKFTAYIASKTALDTFSRIAGRETWSDNVTFTNLRLDLVRTDMIVATDAYRRAPAKSPEQAAALVVRALEDRPVTISTAAGRVGEVLNLLAPRLMDAGDGADGRADAGLAGGPGAPRGRAPGRARTSCRPSRRGRPAARRTRSRCWCTTSRSSRLQVISTRRSSSRSWLNRSTARSASSSLVHVTTLVVR